MLLHKVCVFLQTIIVWALGPVFFRLEQDVACLFFLQGTKCLYKFSEKGKDFHICMGKVVVFL